MLELTVKMININLPVNHTLLQKCMPLYEYFWFMQKIRSYLDEKRVGMRRTLYRGKGRIHFGSGGICGKS